MTTINIQGDNNNSNLLLSSSYGHISDHGSSSTDLSNQNVVNSEISESSESSETTTSRARLEAHLSAETSDRVSSLVEYTVTQPTAARSEHGYVTLADTSRRTDFEAALTLNERSVSEPGCKYLFWATEPGTENYYYFEGWFSERAYSIHTSNQYTWDNQLTITPPFTFSAVIDFVFGANAGVATWGGAFKYGQIDKGNWCRMCTVHPETDKGGDLLTSMLALKTSALATDGCLEFLVLQLFKDKNVIVRVERWATKAHYEAFEDTMKSNKDVDYVYAYADWPIFGTLPSIPIQTNTAKLDTATMTGIDMRLNIIDSTVNGIDFRTFEHALPNNMIQESIDYAEAASQHVVRFLAFFNPIGNTPQLQLRKQYLTEMALGTTEGTDAHTNRPKAAIPGIDKYHWYTEPKADGESSYSVLVIHAQDMASFAALKSQEFSGETNEEAYTSPAMNALYPSSAEEASIIQKIVFVTQDPAATQALAETEKWRSTDGSYLRQFGITNGIDPISAFPMQFHYFAVADVKKFFGVSKDVSRTKYLENKVSELLRRVATLESA